MFSPTLSTPACPTPAENIAAALERITPLQGLPFEDRLWLAQHGEEVIGALLHFGALFSVAAVLDVQRMEMVTLRQNIQLRTVRVPQVMPDHTRSARLIMAR